MESCKANVGLIATPEYLSSALHFTSIISTPIHFFGFFCILFKTPDHMKSVKWYLVNLHVWIVLLDYSLGFLFIPYLLLPFLAGFPLGILRLFGIPTIYQCLFLILVLGYLLTSIVAVFENRFYVVCSFSGKESWKFWRRYWLAGHYIVTFLIVLSLLAVVPDQKSARQRLLEKIPCVERYAYEEELLVFAEDPLLCFILCVVYAFLMIGQPFLFVGFLITYTFRQLKKRTMSQKTSTLQRKFLLALGIQMEVPLVMFLLPFIYGWISILSGYHNQSFVNIAMTIGAFHGFVSTVVMIFVHYPYRETLFNMFIETRMLRQKLVEKEVTQRAGY
ncbi:CRE-SRH-276 protein [Caenorhabditis remanei]|uniref:CRE-SRH-276 protein n=1 Tax=Caenorhabditis remanei TaxID=31234 RepID=E3LI23_CAERE|nr:CRE-SRH-276 protein [Caenorhabditis remanei]